MFIVLYDNNDLLFYFSPEMQKKRKLSECDDDENESTYATSMSLMRMQNNASNLCEQNSNFKYKPEDSF